MNKTPSITHIATASFIGTAIEFYDFYIYAVAVALVIGAIFFPPGDLATQTLLAFLTFGIAFISRPLGAAIFGHWGDRIGRKATLSVSLLLMGISTTLIGLLPSYESIGIAAPVLLCLLRFGQGIGLGGEWGGAALLATENAPAHRRAWYGMFPQLGPSVGFLLATGSFLLLSVTMDESQFQAWGWRIPFLASTLLVAVGLYVRVRLPETPVFTAWMKHHKQNNLPIRTLLRDHTPALLLGALAMVVCYTLFYTSTVFALNYGTSQLHMPRQQFLGMLCIAILFMAVATVLSAYLSDRVGKSKVLVAGSCAAVLSGFLLAPMLASANPVTITVFLSLELFLMGITFAPMGALLPELFPPDVRYTGAGTAYNLGGILGASMAPYLSQILVLRGGLPAVGGYISAAALISLCAVLSLNLLDKKSTAA